jgi:murein DD-endopeptidase MepM/ murein hydrolase activator NlpD
LWFIVVVLLVITMLFSGVTAQSVDDLKENLGNIEDKKQETQKKLDMTKATMQEVLDEIRRLNEDITNIETTIATLQTEVADMEAQLLVVREELRVAELERTSFKGVLDERIRVMYMFGDASYLEVLFSAESFGDFISKIDMIRTVMEYDKEVFLELERIESQIQGKKDQIEVEKNNIIAKQNEARRQRTNLDSVVVSRESTVASLQQNQRLLEEQKRALELESQKIKTQILAKQTINQKINSIYRWPVPGVARISSPFGWRTDPIFGGSRFHAGIDISTQGRAGFNAVAVGNGEVIDSRYSSSYGNMVTMDMGLDDKGNRVSAVYAHLARRYVSVGQRVIAGTPLGEVGTTGWSTGIHLHFEIRINGNPVNPLGYVSP